MTQPGKTQAGDWTPAVTKAREWLAVLAAEEDGDPPSGFDEALDALCAAVAAALQGTTRPTREQVEALRQQHVGDCLTDARRIKLGEKFCHCGAREHNETLDDVLALWDTPAPEPSRKPDWFALEWVGDGSKAVLMAGVGNSTREGLERHMKEAGYDDGTYRIVEFVRADRAPALCAEAPREVAPPTDVMPAIPKYADNPAVMQATMAFIEDEAGQHVRAGVLRAVTDAVYAAALWAARGEASIRDAIEGMSDSAAWGFSSDLDVCNSEECSYDIFPAKVNLADAILEQYRATPEREPGAASPSANTPQRCVELMREVAQNDYMIDQHYLGTGARLMDAADALAALYAGQEDR